MTKHEQNEKNAKLLTVIKGRLPDKAKVYIEDLGLIDVGLDKDRHIMRLDVYYNGLKNVYAFHANPSKAALEALISLANEVIGIIDGNSNT